MEPICSMTTLWRNPPEVKDAAKTTSFALPNGALMPMCSSGGEAFEKRVAQERESSAFVARLVVAVGRGVADIKAGRYVTTVDEAFSRAALLRNGCAEG